MRVSKKSAVDCGGSVSKIDEVVALEKIIAVKDKVKAAVHSFNQSKAVKKKKKKALDPASMDEFVKANDSVLNRLKQAMSKDGIASTRHLSAVRVHLTSLEDTPKSGTSNDARDLEMVQLALAYARAGAAEPWLVAAALAAAARPLRNAGPSRSDTEQGASRKYLDPIPTTPPAGTAYTVSRALLAAGMAGYCAPSHLTVQLLRLAESELISSDYSVVAQWCNAGLQSLQSQDHSTSTGASTGSGSGNNSGQVHVVAGSYPPVGRRPEDLVHSAAAGQVASLDTSQVRLADVLKEGSAPHHETFRDWVSKDSRPIQEAPLAVQQQMMVAAADALDRGELVRSFETVSSLLVAASLSLEPLDAYLYGYVQEDDSEAVLEGGDPHSDDCEAGDDWHQQEDLLPADAAAGDEANAEPNAPVASSGVGIASVRAREMRDTEYYLEAMKLLRTLAITGEVGDGLIASDDSEPHTPAPVADSTAATARAEVYDALYFGEQPYPADSRLLDTIYLQKYTGSPDRKRKGKKQGVHGDEHRVYEVLGHRHMRVGYGMVMEELCPAVEMLQRRCAALAVRCASKLDELNADEALRGRVAGAAAEAALAMGRLERMGYASCSFDDDTSTYGFGKLREAVHPQRATDVVWHMRAALSSDLGESPSVQSFLDTRIKETARGVRTLEVLCKDWQLTRHALARRGRAFRHSEEYWVEAHRYNEQEANAELKTAQEMAAVSYQLGLAACRSLILGLGHASADSTLSAPTESSMGPDHLAGQAESVCGLLQASSSLGYSSNDVAGRLHGMVREASAKMQHHAVHWGALDPRLPAATMAVLAREQLPQMSAAQTMQYLDELVAERIEPQVMAARKAGSMRCGTGPEGRRALLAACTSSWSLACQLDALAQSAEELAEVDENTFVESTEELKARTCARVMGIESQLALLQSRLLARAQDVQILLQPHAGAISGMAASAELQFREQVTLQYDWGDERGSAVASLESLLSSPGLADPRVLAKAATLAVGVSGHTVSDTQSYDVDDAKGWMHATAAMLAGYSEPYASEAWHDLMFGTEGCTTVLTAWPEGSRGTVRAVNKRNLTSNSFRLPLSLARPADAGVVGSYQVQLMVGKQLAHPPRARPVVSAIDALRMLWVCAIIDTASVSSARATRDASQRVLRHLVPILLLRLHGPMAEAELCSNLGLYTERAGPKRLQSTWAFDPMQVDGRRAWIVPNEAIGQDSGPVVRPGMRMEAGCVHGVLGWLSRGVEEEQQEGGSEGSRSDWMHGLFVPSGLAALGEMLE